MDSIFGSIQVTSLIKIKRTDGRVHYAKVVQLSPQYKSVGVEWKENDEVKGKEISVDLVFELNEELKPDQSTNRCELAITPSISEQKVNTVLEASSPIKLPSVALDIENFEREYDARPLPTLPNRLLRNMHSASATSVLEPSPPSLSTVKSNSNIFNPIQRRITITSTEATNSNNNVPATRSTARSLVQNKSSSSTTSTSNPSTNNTKSVRCRSRPQVSRKATAIVPSESNQISPIGLHGPFGQMIFEYRSTLNYTPMNDLNNNDDQFIDQKDLRICVAVRKRPLNKREIAAKDNDVITIPTKDQCIVHVPKSKVDLTKYLDNSTFKFDYTFDEHCSTELVYLCTTAPLIDTIFTGGNATVFAYGQTGSGKTFTMGGDTSSTVADYSKGIYAQTARDIFDRLERPEHRSLIEIHVTFYEIYCGKVFDLLNNKKRLRVLEDQNGLVQVCDRKEQQVKSVDDVLGIIQEGMSARTSGTTSANSNSSRSHAVLQLILKTPAVMNLQPKVRSSSISSRQKQTFAARPINREVGKMSLIDLAGSERGKDTADGDRLQRMEGSEINKSLLALKECIRALGRGDGAHVPFRGSTLTKVLRDSFIGEKSKICMIAMISPIHSDVENTMNTLRYADRVKELRTNTNDDNPLTHNDRDDEQIVEVEDIEHLNESIGSSDDNLDPNIENDDGRHDEVFGLNSDAVSQLQKFQSNLFNTYHDILNNQEPILTQTLQNILKNAQETVDFNQEKFINALRANLLRRQKILRQLQETLETYANCVQTVDPNAAHEYF